MKGYVAKKGNQFYAVIYEGLDPVTGKEKRTWHPAGPDRSAAEKLARELAAEIDGRGGKTRPLTFGAYLTEQWLPGKANTLAESTWHGYRRKIERHILPSLGKVPIRRLKVTDLEALYDAKLRPTEEGVRALAPKTVLEIHLIIRGALTAAVKRGVVTRNVATVAHAPRLRSIPKHEAQAWTADQLSQFLQAAVGHRLFTAFWLAAYTGVRRSELLGLKWSDIDLDKATVSINRGLVAIGYELCESRGKTANSRREHRPRPHHHRRPRSVESLDRCRAPDRRQRHPPCVYHQRRRPRPPPLDLPSLRTRRPQRRTARDPVPRLCRPPRYADLGRKSLLRWGGGSDVVGITRAAAAIVSFSVLRRRRRSCRVQPAGSAGS